MAIRIYLMAIERVHLNKIPFDKNGYHATGDYCHIASINLDNMKIEIDLGWWYEYEDEIYPDYSGCIESYEDEIWGDNDNEEK